MPKGQSNRRRRLAEAQNWRCAYCAGLMHQDGNRLDGATVEHLLPLVLGGARSSDNLVAACRACNNSRSGFYSHRIFYSIRRWQLRKGRWPPCTFPNKRVRKVVLRIFAEAETARLAKAGPAQPDGSRDLPALLGDLSSADGSRPGAESLENHRPPAASSNDREAHAHIED